MQQAKPLQDGVTNKTPKRNTQQQVLPGYPPPDEQDQAAARPCRDPHTAQFEGKWPRMRPTRHPGLVVEASLRRDVYNKTGLQAPNVSERGTIPVASMLVTGVIMCLTCRKTIKRMAINLHNLLKT